MEEEEEATYLRRQVLQNTIQEVQSQKKDAETVTPDPCVICLEAVSEPALAAPCRHDNFDFLCLISWLQERATCPLCKLEVRQVEYDRKDPGNCKVYEVPEVPEVQNPARNVQSRISTHDRVSYRGNRVGRARRIRGACPRRPENADAALLRRRHIYQHGLYSLHVGSNRLSRFRDLTPDMFNKDAELVTRARKWIRRELQVFEFLSMDDQSAVAEAGVTRRANNAEFLLEYIVAILKTVNIKGSSGQAEEMLQDFLGRDNAKLFLHELRAWLRSPYTELSIWDRWVQYPDTSTQADQELEDPPTSRALPRTQNRGPRRAAQRYTQTSRFMPYKDRIGRSATSGSFERG